MRLRLSILEASVLAAERREEVIEAVRNEAEVLRDLLERGR
jgi:hypothetical protein